MTAPRRQRLKAAGLCAWCMGPAGTKKSGEHRSVCRTCIESTPQAKAANERKRQRLEARAAKQAAKVAARIEKEAAKEREEAEAKKARDQRKEQRRARRAQEIADRRAASQISCSRCGGRGHQKRTCPNPDEWVG